MSDDSHGMFVKFKRNGTLVWQLGGTNPLGKSFKLVGLTQWTRNHGHHLTPDGRFLFFNNDGVTGTDAAAVWEVMLDETAGTATKTFEYHFTAQGRAVALGDVERSPNGNALLTHTGAFMVEVDRSGAVVQSFVNMSSGYGFADFGPRSTVRRRAESQGSARLHRMGLRPMLRAWSGRCDHGRWRSRS